MKKYFFAAFFLALIVPVAASAAIKTASSAWKPKTPEDYAAISWAKAKGVATFMKAPSGNGYLDFLTEIYLPYVQVKLVASTSPRLDWGPGADPFATDTVRDWAFAKMEVEQTKQANPNMEFLWNVPFFNATLTTTDLSMALKSEDASSTYITSGSRPPEDVDQERRMLIVNNVMGTATITDFDPGLFMSTSTGDQAVEGFAPDVTYKGTAEGTARLFLGVKPGGKELVIYCSQGASPQEASDALNAAGVPVESQMQADGGTSATCAYNMPGQYFVEPGRTLPHIMGAFSFLYRGKTTTDGLNVRGGPGTKYPILEKLPKSQPLQIFAEKSGFAKISSERNEWVSLAYIKKVQ